jgi:hypothetical protein
MTSTNPSPTSSTGVQRKEKYVTKGGRMGEREREKRRMRGGLDRGAVKRDGNEGSVTEHVQSKIKSREQKKKYDTKKTYQEQKWRETRCKIY